jgi:type IV secretory pathway VirJ component
MQYLVIGVNDLRLFEHEMSGDSLARVMRTLTAHVRGAIPRGAPLLLFGYSFGADIASDALARGADVDGVVLLGPGERGVRHITLGGLLFREPTGPTSFDNVERLNARPCVPVAFITGADDHSGKGAAIFPRVRQPAAQFLVAEASHHYHGGDARYTAQLRAALDWLAAHACRTDAGGPGS